MDHLNVEIKAKCSNPAEIRNYLTANNATFTGIDEQTDTYFNVREGRLKLREGTLENNLIYYNRADQSGPKHSSFRLIRIPDAAGFKAAMEKAIGIKAIVRKKREIYYIANVKFHIDEVDGLGSFVEIEAGNLLAEKSADELEKQCRFYLGEFGIRETDLVSYSYSDMLLAQTGQKI